MSNNNGSISGRIKELRRKVESFKIEAQKLADKAGKDAGDAAKRKYGEYEQQKVHEIFNRAITEFYSAYSPVLYARQGDVGGQEGGLYALWNPTIDEYGRLVYVDAGDLVDPSLMHAGREGARGAYSDLFNKVYILGWHGGAESGNKHPSPGTPYYRKPYPSYYRWGSAAVQSDSPDSLFREYMAGAAQDMRVAKHDIYAKVGSEVAGKLATDAGKLWIDIYKGVR